MKNKKNESKFEHFFRELNVKKVDPKEEKIRVLKKRIVDGVIVLVYTVAVTFASYSFGGNVLESGFDDLLYQQGQITSGEVFVIGVTKEDLDYYENDASVLLAQVAKTLSEKTKPVTVTFDVPINTISDTSREILTEINKNTNLVLPLEIDMPSGVAINDYGHFSKTISSISISSANDSLSQFALKGHTIRLYDKGGIFRHATLSIPIDGAQVRSIAYVNYETYCNEQNIVAKYPKTNDGNVVIKFVNRQEFVAYNTISVRDFNEIVDESPDELSFFDNKIVYLGYMASNLDHGFLTAVDHDNAMYSVELDAQITLALLKNNTAINIPQYIQGVGFAVTTFLLAVLLLVVINKSNWIGICFSFIYILMNRVVTVTLYGVGYSATALPHYASAIVTVALVYLFIFIWKLMYQNLETKSALSRYVSQKLEKTQASGMKSAKLTILFADIRGFTSFSEKVTPEKLGAILSQYLSVMAKCVEENYGTVDKFIGDCIMAYWGDPEDPDSSYHACLAALQMQRMAKQLSEKLISETGEELAFGIGINTGHAVIGPIGSEKRMNYTALGDSVNMAERFESKAPGGCIYISESVYDEIKQYNASVEELPPIELKGKAVPQKVFSLKTLSWDFLEREEEEKQQIDKNLRFRTTVGVILNAILLLSNAVFILNSFSTYGLNSVHYYSVLMASLACFVSAGSMPFLLIAAKRGEPQPPWMDIIRVSALVGGLYTLVTFCAFIVPKIGWTNAISGEGWPGGIWINIITPVLYLILFFYCETKRPYRAVEVLFAELPLVAIRVLGYFLTTQIAEGFEDVTDSFQVYYAFPGSGMSVIGEMLVIIFILCLSEFIRTKEAVRRVKRQQKWEKRLEKIRQTKLYALMQEERFKSVILLLVDFGMLGSCIKVLITANNLGSATFYNNVSLLMIPIVICCFVILVYNINAIAKNQEDKDQAFYRYASFARNYLWVLVLGTAAVMAISNGNISTFVSDELGGDFLIYLIWPIVSFIVFVSERNEYKLPVALLFSLAPVAILFISKSALENLGSEQLASKYLSYYTPSTLAIFVAADVLMIVFTFFANEVFKKLYLRRTDTTTLTICGTRSDNRVLTAALSEYGNSSECFVLRDREYALVINAGSGLVNARQALYGCSNVDFVVLSDNPDMRLGFMYAEEICQYAKFRVISPFGKEAFGDIGSWNRKLRKVKDKNWVNVEDNQATRLTDDYFIKMIPMASDPSKRMIQITGRTKLLYLPDMSEDVMRLQSLASGSKYLICDTINDAQKACYLSIDCNVKTLIVSGYSTDTNDEMISKAESQAKKILEGVRFAREEVIATK